MPGRSFPKPISAAKVVTAAAEDTATGIAGAAGGILVGDVDATAGGSSVAAVVVGAGGDDGIERAVHSRSVVLVTFGIGAPAFCWFLAAKL
jgi:hypothetical protein